MPTATIPTGQFSEWIDRALQGQRDALRESTLGHQEALEELAEVWEECRNPDWDGFGALAIEQDTLRSAYMLIESLPLGFPRPSLGAEPDGQITLEWHRSPQRTLSVSVDSNGFLHYAGLFGASKRYGTLTFFSTAPTELLQLVRDL